MWHLHFFFSTFCFVATFCWIALKCLHFTLHTTSYAFSAVIILFLGGSQYFMNVLYIQSFPWLLGKICAHYLYFLGTKNLHVKMLTICIFLIYLILFFYFKCMFNYQNNNSSEKINIKCQNVLVLFFSTFCFDNSTRAPQVCIKPDNHVHPLYIS